MVEGKGFVYLSALSIRYFVAVHPAKCGKLLRHVRPGAQREFPQASERGAPLPLYLCRSCGDCNTLRSRTVVPGPMSMHTFWPIYER